MPNDDMRRPRSRRVEPDLVFAQLPDPARSLAEELSERLVERGYPRNEIVAVAAELAVSYVAERVWDASVVPEELLERVEDALFEDEAESEDEG